MSKKVKVEVKKAPVVEDSSDESNSSELPIVQPVAQNKKTQKVAEKAVLVTKKQVRVQQSEESESEPPVVAKKAVKSAVVAPVAKVAAKKPVVEESSEDSSEEEAPKKPVKAATKVVAPVAKVVAPVAKVAAKKPVVEESSEDDSDDVQVPQIVTKKAPVSVVKAAKNVKAPVVEESDDDTEEEVVVPVKKGAKTAPVVVALVKAATKAVVPAKKPVVESSEEESSEEVKPVKAATKAVVPAKVAAKKPVVEESEEESSEEEPVKPVKAATKAVVPAKKPVVEESEEESSEEVVQAKKAAKKASVQMEIEEVKQEVKAIIASDPNQIFEIYVKNLSFKADENDIGNHFQSFGEVEAVKILKDETGRSKGGAFVKFENEEGMNKALKEGNNSEICGRAVTIERSKGKVGGPAPGQDRPKVEITDQTLTIFVGNLSFKTDENSLRQFFSSCGEVLGARVKKDDDGNSKGFGHVDFSCKEDVQKAVLKHQGNLDGRNIRVDVAAPRTGGGDRGGFGGGRGGGGRGGFGGGGRGGNPALSANDKAAQKGTIAGFAGTKKTL